jgi:SAM-dependent methyltransferase
MSAPADNLFELPGMRKLLDEEARLAAEQALRQPAGRALLVLARADPRGVDMHHLSSVLLHARDGALAGAVRCDADALPFEDGAFRLVVAQHCADALVSLDGLAAEFARVLAPGGALLWFGLNPWNALGLSRRLPVRGGPARGTPLRAGRVRQLLLRHGLGPFRVRGLGAPWPQAAGGGSRWLDPLRGAYLIQAGKQTVMPLRPPARAIARRARVSPSLAATPSRRACA